MALNRVNGHDARRKTYENNANLRQAAGITRGLRRAPGDAAAL
jgi:hypothetical protein